MIAKNFLIFAFNLSMFSSFDLFNGFLKLGLVWSSNLACRITPELFLRVWSQPSLLVWFFHLIGFLWHSYVFVSLKLGFMRIRNSTKMWRFLHPCLIAIVCILLFYGFISLNFIESSKTHSIVNYLYYAMLDSLNVTLSGFAAISCNLVVSD